MKTLLDEAVINSLAAQLGCRYEVHTVEEIDSTNNELKRLAAEGAPEGYVLMARSQTAGKGRLGRSFFSPKSGIYTSLLLRPMTAPEKTLFFTTAAAVAVCRAIEQTSGVKTQIKWVNDVYIGERKVCGILTESAIESGVTSRAVIGIGVNIAHPRGGFPAEISDRACAIFDGCPPEGFENTFAAALVSELYNIFSSGEYLSVDEYRRRSMVLGRQLSVSGADGRERACTAVDIDDTGALIVEYTDGTRGRLFFGEVSIKF